MSVLPIESGPAPQTRPTDPAPRTEARQEGPAPVLITEQEVLLGSAVASGLRAEPAPGWLAATAATVRRVFAAPAHDRPARPQRWYPPRNSYLDNARMSREMYRL